MNDIHALPGSFREIRPVEFTKLTVSFTERLPLLSLPSLNLSSQRVCCES